MFTDPLKLAIHRRFLDGIGDLGLCEDEILEHIDRCSGDLLTVMEFYYAGMPVKDIGEYSFEFLLKIASFSLAIEQDCDWAEQIPEEVRLNYVLNYRVDTEQVENCREYFYDALKDRIRGKSPAQALLEIHSWCAEHVEYRPSAGIGFCPTEVLKAGGGDSRQLSVLEVTVLRSVGIPARVVYTPAWSHRDGGLFWAETWYDGSWHYGIACRPDPLISRNWFAGTVARAMFVLTHTFLPMEGEERLSNGKRNVPISVLSRYASVKRLTVTVTNSSPVAGAAVHFELLNSSELVSALTLTTDETGTAALTAGYGSFHIYAVKDGYSAQTVIDTAQTDHVLLELTPSASIEFPAVNEFILRPPKDAAEFFTPLTDIQKAKKKSECDWAAQARKDYLSGLFREESAQPLAARFDQPERVLNLLRRSKGNYDEIYQFLLTFYNMDTRKLKLDFLESLPEEDLCGVRADVLSDHFQAALPFRDRYDNSIFVHDLLNPKIGKEPITAYRSGILSTLGAHGAIIRKDPRLLWRYVNEFPVQTGTGEFCASPLGMLKTGLMDETGRKILFIALCRTFGFAARFNPVDLTAEYYFNGAYRSVCEKLARKASNAVLTLTGGEMFQHYRKHWTLAVLKNGCYQTMNLDRLIWSDGKLKLPLRPGCYRLITSVRVTGGNVYCIKTVFSMKNGETKELELTCHTPAFSELMGNASLIPFRLYNMHYRSEMLDEIVKDKPALMIWLQESENSTERLLLDLIKNRPSLSGLNCKLIFIVRNHLALAYPTLILARREFPGVQIYNSDFDDSPFLLSQRLGLEDNVFPLTAVMRPGPCAVYAFAGYEEGLAERLLGILKLVSDEAAAKA